MCDKVSRRLKWENAKLPDHKGTAWQRGPGPNETKYSAKDTLDLPTAYGPLSYVDIRRRAQRRERELKDAWHDVKRLRKLLADSKSFVESERIEKRICRLESPIVPKKKRKKNAHRT